MSKAQETDLAINGGLPAVTHPLPPMYPGGMRIDEEEEAAVLDVLRTKRLFRYYGPNPGPSKVDELEQAFAARMGSRFAIALSSGTAALVVGLIGLGVGPGDEVIVPAYTWIATASAVAVVGAVPIIAEVDDSLTLDPRDVEQKISPYTKAIIPVHMRGAPGDMDALMSIARARGLKVLEDAAQADGGSYHGKALGTIGDVGIYSLQFNKIITSGEGGLLVTDDEEVYKRALMVHDVIGGQRNGIPASDVILGMNFRMPELLAAVMLVQLKRLDNLVQDMRQRKTMIKESIAALARRKGVQFRTIHDAEGEAGVAIMFMLPESAQAEAVAEALSAEGVPAGVIYSPNREDYHIYAHWAPVMNQRAWAPNGGPWINHAHTVRYQKDMCPKTLDLLGRCVHIDVSPDLDNSQVEEITEALHKVLSSLA